MLAIDVLSPAQTERSWPVVLFIKKRGSLRLLGDFRKLNYVTICGLNPSTAMMKFIGSSEYGQTIFTLSTKVSYWQIEVKKFDKAEIEFTSHHRL